jgi:hypothetical protein
VQLKGQRTSCPSRVEYEGHPLCGIRIAEVGYLAEGRLHESTNLCKQKLER